MNHSLDVAQSHKTYEVRAEKMEKGVAHLPPGEGRRLLRVFGELVTCKVTGDQTGGAYTLFEATTPPGAGLPPHVHHREDESFYVLEGEYEFSNGRVTLRVGAGCLIYVSKGTLHSHRGVGEGVGRMLLTQTPGGLYECFFEKAGRTMDGDDGEPPTFEDRPDVERRIVEVAAEFGIEIPPPSQTRLGGRRQAKGA